MSEKTVLKLRALLRKREKELFKQIAHLEMGRKVQEERVIEQADAAQKEDLMRLMDHFIERGKEEILNKVVEECSEVITASRNETKERIIAELADLAYHTLVLMVEEGISPEDVYAELESRFAKPGLKPKQ